MGNRINITRKQTGATWEHVITDCEMVAVRLYGKSDEAAQAVADALFPKRVAMSTKPETAAEVLAEMRRDTLSEAYTYTAEIEKYIDRLERAHANDLASLLPGPDYMDPPDGGDVTLLEQCRRMSEDAAKWRALSAQGEAVAGWIKTDNWRQTIEFTNLSHVRDEWAADSRVIVHPVYTHPAPARVTGGNPLDLISFAEGRIQHLNRGTCPGAIEGFGSRDPECPVCAALTAALEADHG